MKVAAVGGCHQQNRIVVQLETFLKAADGAGGLGKERWGTFLGEKCFVGKFTS